MAYRMTYSFLNRRDYRAITSKPDDYNSVLLAEGDLEDMDEFTFRLRVFELLYEMQKNPTSAGYYRG